MDDKKLGITNTLEEDYKILFPQYEDFARNQEWKKEGDIIHEFTMFEDYPPSFASSNTTLIK